VTNDDWYFIASAIFALLGLLGMDWKIVQGRLTMPGFNKRHWLFLLLIIASLSMSGIGWYRSTHRNYLHWQITKQELVFARTYRNETIDIDGKNFDRCRFINVTLRYHGMGPTTFAAGNRFDGIPNLLIDNVSVKAAFVLQKFLSDIASSQGGQMKLFVEGKDGSVVPFVGANAVPAK
jgi:hypothetical protein